jgi:ADP-ribosylglycohydrolase
MLGGAIGDALGAPVEFQHIEQIRQDFADAGIQEFAAIYGPAGAVTDDTQMTLFTAEGLLRARGRQHRGAAWSPTEAIHRAYMRWLHTQNVWGPLSSAQYDGWLVTQPELHSRRAPGNTCVSALRASTAWCEPADNDSKGCGAVMRVAPIGLLLENPRAAYDLACESAQITHAHASSTLASGCFAYIIAALMNGGELENVIADARAVAATEADSDEVVAAIDAALSLAASNAPSAPEAVEQLGGGWVAEEALAISLYCGIRAQSFEHALRLAVNHSGDSDSTGSMTGQLLGAAWGIGAVPERWLQAVELRDVIDRLASDLATCRAGECPDASRYPD